MSKKRVYELARELDMQNKELVDWLQAHGYDDVKSHSSSLDADQAQAVIDKIMAERNPQPAAQIPAKGFVVRRRRAAAPTPPAPEGPTAPSEETPQAAAEAAPEEAPAVATAAAEEAPAAQPTAEAPAPAAEAVSAPEEG